MRRGIWQRTGSKWYCWQKPRRTHGRQTPCKRASYDTHRKVEDIHHHTNNHRAYHDGELTNNSPTFSVGVQEHQNHTPKEPSLGTPGNNYTQRQQNILPKSLSISSLHNNGVVVSPAHANLVPQLEIELSTKFSFESGCNVNDVALFLGHTIDMEKSSQSPTFKDVDVTYNENTISEYYSGMKVKGDRKRIVDFTKTSSPEPFIRIQNHSYFADWL